MKFQQVLDRCKLKGINISRMGLYNAGIKHGFIEKDKDTNKNVFKKENFEKWVEMKLETVPEGYASLKDCAKLFNVPLNTVYYWYNESDLETVEIGPMKVKYVDVEKFREFVKIRKHGSEKEYGN